jgi:hypothetical protein
MHMFICLVYYMWFSLSMIFLLEILVGCGYLFCRTLFGGKFWRNKPSLGFCGA